MIDIGQVVFDEVAWIKMEEVLLVKVEIKLVVSYDYLKVWKELVEIGVVFFIWFFDVV